MKQLAVGVLLAALLPLGYKLVGTFTAEAGVSDALHTQHETTTTIETASAIQPVAARLDAGNAERTVAPTESMSPHRTHKSEDASKRSRRVPRSAAKPLSGDSHGDFGTARTPPPVPPPAPLMVGPDGIVFRKTGPLPSVVSMARLTPPPPEVEAIVKAPEPEATPEPVPESAPVVREDRPASPEPIAAPQPVVVPTRGKMVGPDGIEYLRANH